jgi:hypothetical protein
LICAVACLRKQVEDEVAWRGDATTKQLLTVLAALWCAAAGAMGLTHDGATQAAFAQASTVLAALPKNVQVLYIAHPVRSTCSVLQSSVCRPWLLHHVDSTHAGHSGAVIPSPFTTRKHLLLLLLLLVLLFRIYLLSDLSLSFCLSLSLLLPLSQSLAICFSLSLRPSLSFIRVAITTPLALPMVVVVTIVSI